MYGNVDVFPTWRRALLARWAFSHVQGEVFFRRPGHMLAPSRNFCGDLYPKIPSPHAFSHLLPLPAPGDPGSNVFTHSDLGPPDDTGWCLGSIAEVAGPPPPRPAPPPQQSMLSPLWHKSEAARSPGSHRTDRPPGRLEGREEPCAAQPGTSWRLRPGTHFSAWTHGLACGCVFSQAEGPSPPSTALDPSPPPAGLGPGTRFFLTPQVEQTSDWGRGWRTNPEGSLRTPSLQRC